MSKITKHLLILLGITFMSAGLFYQTTYSQSNKGSIIGTIKDPNDAVVPEAKVVVTNNANGESIEVTSSSSSDFTVTILIPEITKFQSKAAASKHLVLSSVTVETNSRVPVDVKFTDVSGVGDNIVTITAAVLRWSKVKRARVVT